MCRLFSAILFLTLHTFQIATGIGLKTDKSVECRQVSIGGFQSQNVWREFQLCAISLTNNYIPIFSKSLPFSHNF